MPIQSKIPDFIISEVFEDLFSHKTIGDILREHLEKCREARCLRDKEVSKWKSKAEHERWVNGQLRKEIRTLRREIIKIRNECNSNPSEN